MEIDPFAIIQIDATVITGILILLTITNHLRPTDEFWLPKSVATIVIPFSISALFAIWETLKEFSNTPEGNFMPASLLAMFIGFLYLIVVIFSLSSKNKWKKKTS
ncbi:MAG: hypothetical protein K8Q89_10220 [Nitrosarchaeum sp.]|nr:hypothetical protein [Nitrosarchaeum sp.]